VLIDAGGGNNVIAVMGTTCMRSVSVSVFGQGHINIKNSNFTNTTVDRVV
jgi:hypothetical protein